MPEARTVYVIDDEEAVRDSVMLLLEARFCCTKLRIGCGIPRTRIVSPAGVRHQRHAYAWD
jgi:hypothetical protein